MQAARPLDCSGDTVRKEGVPMKKVIVFVGVYITLLILPMVWQRGVYAFQFSPFTTSPTESDIPKDGKCLKGRFECRWGGACVQDKGKCMNCTEGYSYNPEIGCYKCGEG